MRFAPQASSPPNAIGINSYSANFGRQYDPSHRQVTTAYRHSLIGNHETGLKHEILQQSLLIHATASSRHQRQRMSVNRVASQESRSIRLRSAPLRSAPSPRYSPLHNSYPRAQPHQPHPIVPLSSKILPPTTPLM